MYKHGYLYSCAPTNESHTSVTHKPIYTHTTIKYKANGKYSIFFLFRHLIQPLGRQSRRPLLRKLFSHWAHNGRVWSAIAGTVDGLEWREGHLRGVNDTHISYVWWAYHSTLAHQGFLIKWVQFTQAI